MDYVACQQLRFGDDTIMPGEPVPGPDTPIGRGRDYANMLNAGQIKPAPGSARPARAERQEPQQTPELQREPEKAPARKPRSKAKP